MRQTATGWLLLLLLTSTKTSTTASTKQLQSLDRVIVSDHPIDLASPPGDKVIASRLAIVSHLMGIPVGLEEATEPFVQRSPRSPADLNGLTVRAALEELVAEDPRYQWRDMNGVIVVRPVSSWNDCSHFLNRRVSVTRDRLTMNTALAALFTLIDPVAPETKNPALPWWSSDAFQLEIHDSPVLEAFNEIARVRQMSWQISSAPPASGHRVLMSLTLRAPNGSRAGLSREVEPVPGSCGK